MKFYKLQRGTRIKGLWDNPQIYNEKILNRSLLDFLDYESLNLISRQAPMPLNMTWDTIPPIGLYPQSKITDILTGGNMLLGLAVNEKFKTLVSQFNLPPHKYYPLTIKCRGKEYNYYWLHITLLPTETKPVNLDRTLFTKYKDNNHTSVEGAYKFNSLREAADNRAMIDGDAELWLEKSAFQYDLFNIRLLWVYECQYIISERLRNALVENKITGIEISEALWVHAVEF